MKSLSCVIFILIFLSGCGTIEDRFCDYKIIPKSEPIKLDERLFDPCKDLTIPQPPLYLDKILINKKEDVAVHVDCKNKNKALIEALRKISNN